VDRKKLLPITSTIHVMKREYCRLRNSTVGSTVGPDVVLDDSGREPFRLAKYEALDGARETFSASDS
jgi:hypothetical protein